MSTTTEPSASVLTPCMSMSCSSAMLPTISSRMSSSVISPRSEPYSSTTRAKCVRNRRNSRIWSSSVVVSGTK